MPEKVLRPYHFHGIVLWIVCARVFLALIKMKLSCLQINLLHWHSHSSFCLFDTNMKDTAEILVSQFGNFAFCLEMLFLRTIKYFGHFVLGINIHVIRLLLFPGANFEKDKTDAVIRVYHDKEVKVIKKLSLKYLARLSKCKDKMVISYACSYRCYLTTSCLQFYKKCSSWWAWFDKSVFGK